MLNVGGFEILKKPFPGTYATVQYMLKLLMIALADTSIKDFGSLWNPILRAGGEPNPG